MYKYDFHQFRRGLKVYFQDVELWVERVESKIWRRQEWGEYLELAGYKRLSWLPKKQSVVRLGDANNHSGPNMRGLKRWALSSNGKVSSRTQKEVFLRFLGCSCYCREGEIKRSSTCEAKVHLCVDNHKLYYVTQKCDGHTDILSDQGLGTKPKLFTN